MPLKMKPNSQSGDNIRQFFMNKDKFFNLGARPFFLFYLLCFASFYIFYVYFAPTSIKFAPKLDGGGDRDATLLTTFVPAPIEETYEQTNSSVQLLKGAISIQSVQLNFEVNFAILFPPFKFGCGF